MSFYVGAQVTLSGVFTKYANPIAVSPKLTVVSPSGVKDEYTSFDSTSTGSATKTVTANEVGTYTYAFEDLNSGAYEHSLFEVSARPV